MNVRPLLLALVFVAGVGLSACGKTGELEQPAPLYGEKAKEDYQARKTAAAAAHATEQQAIRERERNDTLFNQNAGPPPEAPYAPPIPGRTDPLGPAPHAPGWSSTATPNENQ